MLRRSIVATSAVKVYTFHKLQPLLNALSPLNGRVWPGGAYNWIFRGQGDSKWPLCASALRNENGIGPLLPEIGSYKWNRSIRNTVKDQIDAETNALFQFMDVLNDTGLALAQPDPYLFSQDPAANIHLQRSNVLRTGKYSIWPWQEIYAHLALAQHSGVATRLLDWTRNSFVAAHFAAISGARKNKRGEFSSVFGFRYEVTRNASMFGEFIEVTRSSNANMRAQEGIFTLQRDVGAKDSPAVRIGLKEAILGYEREGLLDIYRLGGYFPILVQINFPQRLCGEILSHLYMLRETSNRYFPTYEGAANSLKEREYWPPT